MNLVRKSFSKLDKIQLLGVGFVVVWAIDFITKAYWFGIETYQFLWFCSTMLFMAGIGFIYRKANITAAALGITLVFQIPWLLDMISIIFFGGPLSFDASYVYDLTFWQYAITLRHFFMIPVLFYGLTLFKGIKFKDSVFIALYTFVFGMAVSMIFPPMSEDINYAGSLPHHIIQTGDFILNKIVIFAITFILIMLATHAITKIPFENKKWVKSIRILSAIYILAGIILSVIGFIKIY